MLRAIAERNEAHLLLHPHQTQLQWPCRPCAGASPLRPCPREKNACAPCGSARQQQTPGRLLPAAGKKIMRTAALAAAPKVTLAAAAAAVGGAGGKACRICNAAGDNTGVDTRAQGGGGGGLGAGRREAPDAGHRASSGADAKSRQTLRARSSQGLGRTFRNADGPGPEGCTT